jgi:hypothetical protein
MTPNTPIEKKKVPVILILCMVLPRILRTRPNTRNTIAAARKIAFMVAYIRKSSSIILQFGLPVNYVLNDLGREGIAV